MKQLLILLFLITSLPLFAQTKKKNVVKPKLQYVIGANPVVFFLFDDGTAENLPPNQDYFTMKDVNKIIKNQKYDYGKKYVWLKNNTIVLPNDQTIVFDKNGNVIEGIATSIMFNYKWLEKIKSN